MRSSEPIHTQDASQIAVAGCILGAPIALFAAFRAALRAAESQEHAMSHQIEDTGLELDGESTAVSTIPPEESLNRFLVSLRRTVTPFDKMSARFEPAAYDSERKKLDNIKKRFELSGKPASSEAQAMLREAEQLLARYAPG